MINAIDSQLGSLKRETSRIKRFPNSILTALVNFQTVSSSKAVTVSIIRKQQKMKFHGDKTSAWQNALILFPIRAKSIVTKLLFPEQSYFRKCPGKPNLVRHFTPLKTKIQSNTLINI
jgi:hypothetical protein